MENKRNQLKKDFDSLEIIIDNQPFSCWLKDKDGYYLAVNKTFAEYSGVSKKGIVGKNDFELYPQEEATIYVTSDQAILGGEKKQFYESMVKSISYNQVIDPEDREKLHKKWGEDIAENSKSNDEYRIITKSGEEKWVWEQSIPVEDKIKLS